MKNNLDYERYMFENFDKMPVDGIVYPFESLKHDKDKLLAVVKLRIDHRKDFEITNDYTGFKKIIPPNTQFGRSGAITYTIQSKKDTGKLTEKEKNLPDPEWKSYSKAQWDKLIGRKV